MPHRSARHRLDGAVDRPVALGRRRADRLREHGPHDGGEARHVLTIGRPPDGGRHLLGAFDDERLGERQSGPSRLGADFGAARTRGAVPAPPAGLGVCWSPRRLCIVARDSVRSWNARSFSLISALRGGEWNTCVFQRIPKTFPKATYKIFFAPRIHTVGLEVPRQFPALLLRRKYSSGAVRWSVRG